MLLLACLTTIIATSEAWRLVWSDEFNGHGFPDFSKWGYDVGSQHDGWGNQELQYYTSWRQENSRVENGRLVIEARREDFGGMRYTSARLVSKYKGDWKYGRVEVRAKLPSGRGTWPAIWMLPTDDVYGGWPRSGEIDIMEHVGHQQNSIHQTIHTEWFNWKNGNQQAVVTHAPTATSDFNTYALEWEESQLRMYINNQMTFLWNRPSTEWQAWPFNQRFHLLLNIAVGGSWGGQQGVDDSSFPARMEVDYVRVYQK
jgi:beta-glucanase (GH16 family)